MTDAAVIVESFLTLLEHGEAEAACELLAPDVEWRNTGMPTFRGHKVRGMLRDMERRSIGFRVDMHHIAANGPIVLTDRIDYLSYKRWESAFWVCGTFEVRDGLITLWDDHFSMGNLLAGSIRGLLGMRRA
ncbi:epoxide hydrolase [Nocardioides marmoriginsengisoli]|uniref:Epoxide hydrolase n=1 Tax=Nocardioides marmoriginsengisoli TaxID=661483 RepID=A0A3N0CS63_9ACTN|nr:limonene-1,2-epoxide hydrolase family protein [Nocardioides marmoriginsengisoli]RNL65743.1 epoxide hydrolase [Nocardioides marmoriginsengisoli]